MPNYGLIEQGAGEILELQEADVAMMKLKCLQLQTGAVLAFQLEGLVRAFVRHPVLFELGEVEIEESGMAERPLAVRTSLRIHLQQAQVHAGSSPDRPCPESPHHHLPGLVLILQQV
jgi:hypothetical protein